MDTLVKEQLRMEISDTFQQWIDTLSQFKEEQFNLVPFEGSWTPGQIAEHLIKAVSAIPDEHTQPTFRPYDAMATPIGDLFLNFSIKMQTPDFVQPGNSPQDKKEVLEIFKGIKGDLENAARTTDLEATCVDFELPTFGALTRYEWIKFFVFHTQRHTRQLKNVLAVFNGK
ncbi:MAG TPA: DinB family protein [Puia sp.]